MRTAFSVSGMIRYVPRSDKRSDGRVKYNYIKFDQDTIVSPDENGFIKKLIGDWKNNG